MHRTTPVPFTRDEEEELYELARRATRRYGPMPLSPLTRAALWGLRVYLAAMVLLVVLGFVRHLAR